MSNHWLLKDFTITTTKHPCCSTNQQIYPRRILMFYPSRHKSQLNALWCAPARPTLPTAALQQQVLPTNAVHRKYYAAG